MCLLFGWIDFIFWYGSEFSTLCTWGYHEELSVMGIYALNTRKPTFTKETLIKLKAPHAVIVGDFNTPLSSMNLSWKHKLSRHTVQLTEVLGQIDLTYVFKTVHMKAKKYTFFSAPHGTLHKIDHKIGHNTHINIYEKTEIISCLWSDH